tara:strand:- start:14738 stop:15199 length:462 start_codon:yes stop_codon:yes gene_type:complete
MLNSIDFKEQILKIANSERKLLEFMPKYNKLFLDLNAVTETSSHTEEEDSQGIKKRLLIVANQSEILPTGVSPFVLSEILKEHSVVVKHDNKYYNLDDFFLDPRSFLLRFLVSGYFHDYDPEGKTCFMKKEDLDIPKDYVASQNNDAISSIEF